jgi:hypothetical protein
MRTRFGRHLGGLISQPTRPFAPRAAEAKRSIELPPEFSWHDYIVFLLSMAAEIEHSLMVQYLYAAYSLGGAQVPPQHRDSVLEWQQVVLGIAKEEMGHLVTVQNVLKLLGGPLHLDREDYPWVSSFYPYAFTLEPVSQKSLAKYVVAESPDVWPDDIPAEERTAIEKLASDDGVHPVARVGVLYDKMIAILSDAKYIPDNLFRPDTYPYQASWDEWGRGYADGKRGSTPKSAPNVLVIRAASRTQAVAALKAVAEQGEAVSTAQATEDSHFRRFLGVYREFSKVAGWPPALALPKDPRAGAWLRRRRNDHQESRGERVGRPVQSALPDVAGVSRPCVPAVRRPGADGDARLPRPGGQSHLRRNVQSQGDCRTVDQASARQRPDPARGPAVPDAVHLELPRSRTGFLAAASRSDRGFGCATRGDFRAHQWRRSRLLGGA